MKAYPSEKEKKKTIALSRGRTAIPRWLNLRIKQTKANLAWDMNASYTNPANQQVSGIYCIK